MSDAMDVRMTSTSRHGASCDERRESALLPDGHMTVTADCVAGAAVIARRARLSMTTPQPHRCRKDTMP